MAGDITTTDEVYRDIIIRLRGRLAASTPVIHSDFVYIAPRPLFFQADELYVQLVPGVPTSIEFRAGTGLVMEEFQVAVWKRVFLDERVVSTIRIADATYGILKTITNVRNSMIQWWGAANLFTVPIVFRRGSVAAESLDYPGWVQMTDTYQVGYEISWVAPAPPTPV